MCIISQLSKDEILNLSKNYNCANNVFMALGIKCKNSTYYYRKWNTRCFQLGINHRTLFVSDEKSKRNNISNEQIINSCQKKFSAIEVLKEFKLNGSGSNFRWINKKITELNIKTLHWKEAKRQQLKEIRISKAVPLNEILIENSTYTNPKVLKKRLLHENMLIYKCYECGISSWREIELVLQLEHKNGNPHDHRIENLSLLCPNCHSQTKTFGGKNAKRYKKDLVKSQNQKSRQTKIKWPNNDILLQMVQKANFSKVGRELGVSGNAIRKRLRKANLI